MKRPPSLTRRNSGKPWQEIPIDFVPSVIRNTQRYILKRRLNSSNTEIFSAPIWLKGFPGSGSGVVYDICFASDAVGYLAHATTTPAGRILRTYDGGYSWNILHSHRLGDRTVGVLDVQSADEDGFDFRVR